MPISPSTRNSLLCMRWLNCEKQQTMPAANSSGCVTASSNVGVVEPELDVRVRARDARKPFDIVERKELIDEHAHLHAAPRGRDELVEHEPARVVAGPDEGLDVDARCAARIRCIAQQRILARLERRLT